MMAVVWLIDVLVIVVKILGGRMKVNPVLRAGMWVAVLSLLLAGCVVLVALVVLLQRWLEGLA
ncbi:hypothetical protein [Nocardia gamkensis]|uniref:Uncharacterized protein n=1 Tax=Nocardia gamkensis TaxID=352869 RepID=A0A7X6R0X6_9NOCA|nr:hypothetical protein [Nocardia gamkensis]NKY24698.1 hypothetical protein [Nocardia gamkensis]NQE69831.1 hypothetical protein [Nocardia gamkensis]